MFDQQQSPQIPQPPRPGATPPPGLPVEDMFAQTDPNRGAVPPQPPLSQPLPVPPSASMPPADLYGGRHFPWRAVIISIVTLLIVAGIAAGAWWAVQTYVLNGEAAPATPAQQPTAPAAVTPEAPPAEPVASSTPTVVDSDSDGLTDDEERALGTNPQRADSDVDGLIDRAEKIYNTDPNNPDTDGDGYQDGDEVIKGYDPAKPGDARLFNVPQNQ